MIWKTYTSGHISNNQFWFLVSIIVILALISYAFAISLSLIPGKLAILGPILASIVAFIFYKLAAVDIIAPNGKESEDMETIDSDIIVTLEEEVEMEPPTINVQDTNGTITTVHTVSLSRNINPYSPLKNNFLMPPLPKSGSRLPPVMSPFSTQSVLSLQKTHIVWKEKGTCVINSRFCNHENISNIFLTYFLNKFKNNSWF